jgi:hypothetical protein
MSGLPTTEPTKYCPGCRRTKPVGEFGANKRMSDGLQRVCKPCRREADQGYRQRHPERVHAAQRSWRQRHKAWKAAYDRARHQDPKVRARRRELARERRQANPEAARAKQAAWRAANREKLRQRGRERYQRLYARPIPPLQERIAAKVRTEPNGCQIWTGATRDDLPYAYDAKRQLNVRRIVFAQANGPIAPGLEIIETCTGGTRCINVEHLIAVTRAERIQRDRAREQIEM